MKILFLHSSSDLYGASKILLAVTELCKESKHEITVVLSEKGMLADQLTQLGIEVRFIDLAILRRQYLSIGGLLNRVSTIPALGLPTPSGRLEWEAAGGLTRPSSRAIAFFTSASANCAPSLARVI